MLRPDITFFGEALPTRFHQLMSHDLPTCDLLIILGTKLSVYPVASLPSMVGELVPRLLINREAVGCFQHVACIEPTPPGTGTNTSSSSGSSSSNSSEESVTRWLTSSYRDVFYQVTNTLYQPLVAS